MKIRNILLFTAVILGFALFTFVVMLSVTYNNVQGDKTELYDQALEASINQTPLVQSESQSFYNGQDSYVVIKGVDEEGDSLYTFIPHGIEDEEDSPEIKYVYSGEGLTEDEMLKQWSSDCSHCDLDEINLGILNNRYVWEIIYERDDRLFFQTYRFSNGELYDSISFKR